MIDQFLTSHGFSSEERADLLAAMKPIALKKKQFFISLGQHCRHLAFIDTGFLRTYHLNEDAKEITTEFHQPSSFCSSFYSFYAQQPSFEYVETITDCMLYLLSYEMLQKLYARSLRWNVLGRTLLEKACVERDLRLKKIMHLSAKDKYEWFLQEYRDVYKVAKLIHVASFLGIKPETLSRARRSLLS